MRLLTLDDLCDYYSNHKNMVNYNADKNSNCPVVVQLEATMTFSDDDYDPELALLKTHLKSCHIGTNRNKSSIERSVMEEAKASIYNRPILGFIHQLSDGSFDFAGHEMFINDDGEVEYEEIPVGCIPESGNAHLVYDEENDKTYLEVDGIIFEEYTRAASILKEKKESKVSVELALLDYSYNPKEKEMVIHIERNVTYTPESGVQLSTPKTAKTIPTILPAVFFLIQPRTIRSTASASRKKAMVTLMPVLTARGSPSRF